MRSSDLTTRARIRDAAILRFGTDGFRAGVRAIAEDAGVSAGLVLHHFGSKDALRQECDRYVLDTIRKAKADGDQSAGALPSPDLVGSFAHVLAYLLRGLQEGGEVAAPFVSYFVDYAREYCAAGVAAGSVVPSSNEEARARQLAMQLLGALLLDHSTRPAGMDDTTYFAGYLNRSAVPTLELLTNGLFTRQDDSPT
ncbi:MAG: TetR family transcriptional regulator [Pseudolysinimonas sp.]